MRNLTFFKVFILLSLALVNLKIGFSQTPNKLFLSVNQQEGNVDKTIKNLIENEISNVLQFGHNIILLSRFNDVGKVY